MEKNGCEPSGILRMARGPWFALGVGTVALLIGMLLQYFFDISLVPVVFGGIVAVAVGVAIRPWDWRVLLVASAAAAIAAEGLLRDWDSMRMLLYVAAAVAAVSAAIVPLPRLVRRLAFSLLIVFHFSAIFCTIMLVNPSPWLPNYLWAHFFQNYLNFVYLTNAYHFYAPEPGPGMMLWFDVRYDDGSDQWVKLPVRSNQRWLLNYQRRLSLPEHANQVITLPGLPPDEILRARYQAGNRDGIPFYYGSNPDPAEYRHANYSAKFMMESYARHVARTTPHPTDPSRQVVGVKAYRVVHRLMTPREVALGIRPDKKWLYQPYFHGEFDIDGHLKNEDDPYLYWLIPIVNRNHPRWSSGQDIELDNQAALHQDDDILDCLEIHSKLPTILPLAPANPGLGAAPIQGAPAPAPPGAPVPTAPKS
jgi:hypothetical protein